MNVLLLHHGDGNAGGGQVAMGRLRNGFKRVGMGARVLCRTTSLPDSIAIPSSPFRERIVGAFTKRIGLNDIHLGGSGAITKLREFQDADVLDIHCLHSETFSYLGLPRLTASKPTVFSFHDMWPMTGHCHASLECDRWKIGCGSCPHPETYPAVRRDATAIEWRLKKWAYNRSRFSIVAPSKWMCEMIQESVFHGFPVHHIPHGVDLDVFMPIDQHDCRRELGIPEGKNVILFAAESMLRPLKGADLLVDVLRFLPEEVRKNSILLLFGQSSPEIVNQVPMPVVDLGYLDCDRKKAVAYSAADLLLNTSRAEAFGLVVLESIACGTPVVTFGVGGVRELVRTGITGLLAKMNDTRDLTALTVEFFTNQQRAVELASQCRKVALAEYSINLQVQRYRKVYELEIERHQAARIP